MAQGDFTKQEAESCEEAVSEIMNAMPKRKVAEYLGHFNDVFLFLATCKRECPDE